MTAMEQKHLRLRQAWDAPELWQSLVLRTRVAQLSSAHRHTSSWTWQRNRAPLPHERRGTVTFFCHHRSRNSRLQRIREPRARRSSTGTGKSLIVPHRKEIRKPVGSLRVYLSTHQINKTVYRLYNGQNRDTTISQIGSESCNVPPVAQLQEYFVLNTEEYIELEDGTGLSSQNPGAIKIALKYSLFSWIPFIMLEVQLQVAF